MISGRPGDGKTFQTTKYLEQMGVEQFKISAANFENKDAGQPAVFLRKTYESAVDWVRRKNHSQLAAIIINDIDTAIGNFANDNTIVQYTVNTQNVVGELMDLADSKLDNSIRVPIILTGNDITKLYEPLKRSGRMRIFKWKLTKNETAKIVRCVYGDFLCEDECDKLIDAMDRKTKELQLPSVTISFYADILARAFGESLWEIHNEFRVMGRSLPCTLSDHEMVFKTSLDNLTEIGLDLLKAISESNFSDLNNGRDLRDQILAT